MTVWASGSRWPSPSQASTRLQVMSEPFADAGLSFLPSVGKEFVDVQPGIVAHHEPHPAAALDCLQLFTMQDGVNSLYTWTNTRAPGFFRDNHTAVRLVCRSTAMFTCAAAVGKERGRRVFVVGDSPIQGAEVV